jgi:hypothetical protein
MSKEVPNRFAKAPRRADPLQGSRDVSRSSAPDTEEANELTIELLEERLTPGYPVRFMKKTAGWGC